MWDSFGMLHLEIVQERLFREFKQEVITTVPNVSLFCLYDPRWKTRIQNPHELPDPNLLTKVEEPYIDAQIISRPEYIG